MGSSTKKKKEKKKDFQKPKLKVGKAKAKAANFTDTSFKSKAIVLNQQSLSTEAPDAAEQFKHNLSLATSRSDKQRRESLSHLISQLSSSPPNNPVGTLFLLDKLLPLIADTSSGVRSQLLKLCRILPPSEVRPHAERVVKWIRMGMTNLSTEVRDDALRAMEWLLDIASDEVVSCPGGWMKTLDTFASMLGWKSLAPQTVGGKKKDGWSSAPKATFGAAKGGATYAHQLTVLGRFLEAGFRRREPLAWKYGDYWAHLYEIPQGSNPFGYLGLFGTVRDRDSEICPDREERQRAFSRWSAAMIKGTEDAKKEGGAVGRAAAVLDQILTEGMADYEHMSDSE
ncbi:Pre-rRNA-processing protein IPI1 [Pleurostoma richardsiae]|uniref:Pre-rRNA-processing protein n=1 Tax=Pleurostoma richardsiae TaxID=41990 RepID=A0AA38VW47_9PEZI|nr:Pre-rRNA-processing protein IPI1 [Pleurostoma richardsiae]